MIIRPQPGPQTELLQCTADIVFYGGAPGGGKSFGIGMDAARWLLTPGYKSLVVRQHYSELMGPDGMFDIIENLVSTWPGVKIVRGEAEIRVPKIGSRIVFRHMQHEKSKKLQQGLQFATIYGDEVTALTESQWWFLGSRNRSLCGVTPYMRATCNPEPGWVADLLDWWIDDSGFAIPARSGVIRWMKRDPLTGGILWYDYPEEGTKSFTFIMASLEDNAFLGQDYADSLNLLDPVEYARLKLCNWKAVASPGDHFQQSWCRWTTLEPDGVDWVRGWDKAGTPDVKADWTSGVRFGRKKDGDFLLDMRSIERLQAGPDVVLETMARAAAQDGLRTTVGCWQDPAQAGKVDIMVTRKALSRYPFKSIVARKKKWEYWRPFTEAAKAGRIELLGPKGPNADAFLATLEGVPEGLHDDDFDAVSLAYQLVHEVPKVGYRPARVDKRRHMLA